MSSISKSEENYEEDFDFESTSEESVGRAETSSIHEVKTSGDALTGNGQVEDEERTVDVRDLKGVSTFEAVVYHMYLNNHHADVFEQVSRAMEDFMTFEGKALNLKQVKQMVAQLKELENKGVSKEEARALQAESYKVSNNFAEKIKIFISQKNCTSAIVNVKDSTILYTDCADLGRFLETEKVREYKIGRPREFLSSWVSMCKETLKNHALKPGFSFLNRVRNSASPMNHFILKGEMEEMTRDLREVVSTMPTTDKKGVYTDQHFSIKVVTVEPKKAASVMSPQIMGTFQGSFSKKDEVLDIVQVEFGHEKEELPTNVCGVTTWKISNSGHGSIEHFDPKKKYLSTEDEGYRDTSTGVLRVLNKVKTKGVVRTKTKVFLKVQWKKKMNNATLAEMNTIGYVHKSVFDTLYSRRAKNLPFENVDPDVVLRSYRFLLIDPLSRMILAIPIKFLAPGSTALSPEPELGMPVRKGLLKVLHLYTSAFSYGVMLCPDWDNLDSEIIKDSRAYFLRASTAFDDTRYNQFVETMVHTLNMLDPMVLIGAGSKSATDPDVTQYFADQDWEMLDEPIDNGEWGDADEDIDF